MQNITLNGRRFDGPSGWHEIDARQLLQIAEITSLKDTVSMVPYHLVLRLFKVPVLLFLKLNRCQLFQLQVTVEWIAGKNTLTKWLLKRVRVGTRIYYGPQDRLADITVEQFIWAEAAYAKWLHDQDASNLNSLFAALYRPRLLWGMFNRSFTPKTFAGTESAVASVAGYVKKAVALNYAGCRNYIIAKHPNIWQVADDELEKTQKRPSQTVNWVSLAIDMSGDKFGTYNQTIKMNLWLFLADMDKKAKQAKPKKP